MTVQPQKQQQSQKGGEEEETFRSFFVPWRLVILSGIILLVVHQLSNQIPAMAGSMGTAAMDYSSLSTSTSSMSFSHYNYNNQNINYNGNYYNNDNKSLNNTKNENMFHESNENDTNVTKRSSNHNMTASIVTSAAIATIDTSASASSLTSPMTDNSHILWKYRRHPLDKSITVTTTSSSTASTTTASNSSSSTTISSRITVLVWPLWDANVKKPSSDVIHIEQNGIQESSILQLAEYPPLHPKSLYEDPTIVWMTDTKYQYKYWCQRFANKLLQAQQLRNEWNQNITKTTLSTTLSSSTFSMTQRQQQQQLLLPLKWPIFIVDFTDLIDYQSCPPVEEIMGLDHVFYFKRSIVHNRHWNHTTQWVELGQKQSPEVIIIESMNENEKENRSESANVDNSLQQQQQQQKRYYEHTPLVVRTDTIESIQRTLQNNKDKYNNIVSLADNIEDGFERSIDISHFWESSSSSTTSSTTTTTTTTNRNINPVASHLRDYMNDLIRQQLCSTSSSSPSSSSSLPLYNCFVGLVGKADIVGRRIVQEDFIQAMLNSKIIVVTQRDKWEDQYRLYEALVSGAMVMTDHMMTLPKGLQNGTSIIEFRNANEFVKLVKYYLPTKDDNDNDNQADRDRRQQERIAIAKQGRYVAMSMHRSWHRMEEIIFGRDNVVTKCKETTTIHDNPSTNPCPFIVHANETMTK